MLRVASSSRLPKHEISVLEAVHVETMLSVMTYQAAEDLDFKCVWRMSLLPARLGSRLSVNTFML